MGAFLGFTHICGKGRSGQFWLRRITIAKRMRAKLAAVYDQLKSRRHLPIPEQGRWLASVLRGHLAYYAVPGNSRAVQAFRTQVTRYWLKALRRRSQRHRLNWERMDRLARRWLPPARILHPYPKHASTLAPEAGAQCGSPVPHAGICAGGRPQGGPYRDWEILPDRDGWPPAAHQYLPGALGPQEVQAAEGIQAR